MTMTLEAALDMLFIRLGRLEFYAHGSRRDTGTVPGIRPGEIVFRVLGVTVYLTKHRR